jgi:nucleoid DNA-binding protein
LNPKKINDLYAEVANELGISDSDLEDIISFYWSRVRKELEKLQEPNIYVDGFGTFYIKPKSLKSEMLKYESFLKSINSKEFTRYPYYKIAKEKLDRLQIISDKVYQEHLRQKQKIDQRYGNTTGSMEEEK